MVKRSSLPPGAGDIASTYLQNWGFWLPGTNFIGPWRIPGVEPANAMWIFWWPGCGPASGTMRNHPGSSPPNMAKAMSGSPSLNGDSSFGPSSRSDPCRAVRQARVRADRRASAQQARCDREGGEPRLPTSGVGRHWPSPWSRGVREAARAFAGAPEGEQEQEHGEHDGAVAHGGPYQGIGGNPGEERGDHRRPRFQSSSRA